MATSVKKSPERTRSSSRIRLRMSTQERETVKRSSKISKQHHGNSETGKRIQEPQLKTGMTGLNDNSIEKDASHVWSGRTRSRSWTRKQKPDVQCESKTPDTSKKSSRAATPRTGPRNERSRSKTNMSKTDQRVKSDPMENIPDETGSKTSSPSTTSNQIVMPSLQAPAQPYVLGMGLNQFSLQAASQPQYYMMLNSPSQPVINESVSVSESSSALSSGSVLGSTEPAGGKPMPNPSKFNTIRTRSKSRKSRPQSDETVKQPEDGSAAVGTTSGTSAAAVGLTTGQLTSLSQTVTVSQPVVSSSTLPQSPLYIASPNTSTFYVNALGQLVPLIQTIPGFTLPAGQSVVNTPLSLAVPNYTQPKSCDETASQNKTAEPVDGPNGSTDEILSIGADQKSPDSKPAGPSGDNVMNALQKDLSKPDETKTKDINEKDAADNNILVTDESTSTTISSVSDSEVKELDCASKVVTSGANNTPTTNISSADCQVPPAVTVVNPLPYSALPQYIQYGSFLFRPNYPLVPQVPVVQGVVPSSGIIVSTGKAQSSDSGGVVTSSLVASPVSSTATVMSASSPVVSAKVISSNVSSDCSGSSKGESSTYISPSKNSTKSAPEQQKSDSIPPSPGVQEVGTMNMDIPTSSNHGDQGVDDSGGGDDVTNSNEQEPDDEVTSVTKTNSKTDTASVATSVASCSGVVGALDRNINYAVASTSTSTVPVNVLQSNAPSMSTVAQFMPLPMQQPFPYYFIQNSGAQYAFIPTVTGINTPTTVSSSISSPIATNESPMKKDENLSCRKSMRLQSPKYKLPFTRTSSKSRVISAATETPKNYPGKMTPKRLKVKGNLASTKYTPKETSVEVGTSRSEGVLEDTPVRKSTRIALRKQDPQKKRICGCSCCSDSEHEPKAKEPRTPTLRKPADALHADGTKGNAKNATPTHPSSGNLRSAKGRLVAKSLKESKAAKSPKDEVRTRRKVPKGSISMLKRQNIRKQQSVRLRLSARLKSRWMKKLSNKKAQTRNQTSVKDTEHVSADEAINDDIPVVDSSEEEYVPDSDSEDEETLGWSKKMKVEDNMANIKDKKMPPKQNVPLLDGPTDPKHEKLDISKATSSISKSNTVSTVMVPTQGSVLRQTFTFMQVLPGTNMLVPVLQQVTGIASSNALGLPAQSEASSSMDKSRPSESSSNLESATVAAKETASSPSMESEAGDIGLPANDEAEVLGEMTSKPADGLAPTESSKDFEAMGPDTFSSTVNEVSDHNLDVKNSAESDKESQKEALIVDAEDTSCEGKISHYLNYCIETQTDTIIENVKASVHQCDFCERSYSQPLNLKNHVVGHCNMRQHCVLCEASFGDSDTLMMHLSDHGYFKATHVFQCPVCERLFTDSALFAVHIDLSTCSGLICKDAEKTVDKETLTPDGSLESLSKAAKVPAPVPKRKRRELVKRMKVGCPHQVRYKIPWHTGEWRPCVICSEMCKSDHLLTSHQSTHSNNHIIEDYHFSYYGKNMGECNLCPRVKTTISRSMKVSLDPGYAPGNLHVCEICGKQVPKSRINVHKAAHKVYQCAWCEQRFTSMGGMRYHRLNTCTGRKAEENKWLKETIDIDIEGHGNISFEYLVESDKVPTEGENRTTECPLPSCQRKFYTAPNLETHQALHSEKLPYVCEVCESVFESPDQYHQHMKEHRVYATNLLRGGLHIYECDLCERRFKDRNWYVMHRKHVHDITVSSVKSEKQVDQDTNQDVEIVDSCGPKSQRNVWHPEEWRPCPVCGILFQSHRKIKAHLAKHEYHSLSGNYQCEICGKNFPSKKKLNYHVALVHSENPPPPREKKFVCDLCGRKFLTMYELDVHKRVHAGETPFQCKLCEVSFVTKYSLIGHEKRVHSDPNVPVKVRNCRICGKKCTGMAGLRRHHAEVHGKDKAYRCLQCQINFKSMSELCFHLTSHRLAKKQTCEVCGIQVEENDIANHQCEPGSFECPDCNVRFGTSVGLKSHDCGHKQTGVNTGLANPDNREYKYQCGVCGKRFFQSSKLAFHARTHSESMLYECNMCKMRFKSRSTLVLHKEKHKIWTIKYPCPMCNMAIATMKALRVHLWKTHLMADKERVSSFLGEVSATYECRVCHITFDQYETMMDHVNQIHEGKEFRRVAGKKQYQVPLCDLECISAVSQQKEYRCNICPKTYKSYWGICSHMKSHSVIVVADNDMVNNKPEEWNAEEENQDSIETVGENEISFTSAEDMMAESSAGISDINIPGTLHIPAQASGPHGDANTVNRDTHVKIEVISDSDSGLHLSDNQTQLIIPDGMAPESIAQTLVNMSAGDRGTTGTEIISVVDSGSAQAGNVTEGKGDGEDPMTVYIITDEGVPELVLNDDVVSQICAQLKDSKEASDGGLNNEDSSGAVIQVIQGEAIGEDQEPMEATVVEQTSEGEFAVPSSEEVYYAVNEMPSIAVPQECTGETISEALSDVVQVELHEQSTVTNVEAQTENGFSNEESAVAVNVQEYESNGETPNTPDGHNNDMVVSYVEGENGETIILSSTENEYVFYAVDDDGHVQEISQIADADGCDITSESCQVETNEQGVEQAVSVPHEDVVENLETGNYSTNVNIKQSGQSELTNSGTGHAVSIINTPMMAEGNVYMVTQDEVEHKDRDVETVAVLESAVLVPTDMAEAQIGEDFEAERGNVEASVFTESSCHVIEPVLQMSMTEGTTETEIALLQEQTIAGEGVEKMSPSPIEQVLKVEENIEDNRPTVDDIQLSDIDVDDRENCKERQDVNSTDESNTENYREKAGVDNSGLSDAEIDEETAASVTACVDDTGTVDEEVALFISSNEIKHETSDEKIGNAEAGLETSLDNSVVSDSKSSDDNLAFTIDAVEKTSDHGDHSDQGDVETIGTNVENAGAGEETATNESLVGNAETKNEETNLVIADENSVETNADKMAPSTAGAENTEVKVEKSDEALTDSKNIEEKRIIEEKQADQEERNANEDKSNIAPEDTVIPPVMSGYLTAMPILLPGGFIVNQPVIQLLPTDVNPVTTAGPVSVENVKSPKCATRKRKGKPRRKFLPAKKIKTEDTDKAMEGTKLNGDDKQQTLDVHHNVKKSTVTSQKKAGLKVKHLVPEQGKRQVEKYICGFCNDDFNYVAALEKHWFDTGCDKKSGHENEPKVYDVDYAFEGQETISLQYTIESPHGTRPKSEEQVGCSLCERQYNLLSNLDLHNKLHVEDLPYLCSFCEAGFEAPDIFMEHLKKHHTASSSLSRQMRIYECHVCERRFTEYKMYRCHVEVKHDINPEDDRESGISKSSVFYRMPNVRREKRKIMWQNGEKRPCPICLRFLNTEASIKHHVDVHKFKACKKAVTSLCHTCGREFRDKAALKAHSMSHLSMEEKMPKSHICEICGKAFRQKVTLDGHIRTHTGEKPFPCPVCGLAFALKGSMKDHIKRMHENPAAQVKVLKCRQCGEECRGIAGIRRHHVEAHAEGKTYHCSKCGSCFPTLSDLSCHQSQHRYNKKHFCSSCGAEFEDADLYAKHVCEVTPYKCGDCGIGFTNFNSWKSHENGHLQEAEGWNAETGKPGKAKHVCPVCGKNYSSSYSLSVHVRSHNFHKPFHCHLCNFRASGKPKLDLHLRREHMKNTEVQCKLCARTLKDMFSLGQHMLRVHRKKEEPTEECYKLIYICPICGKQYDSQGSLSSHLSRKHDGGPLKMCECNFCGITLTSTVLLKKHVESMHGDIEPAPEEKTEEHLPEMQ